MIFFKHHTFKAWFLCLLFSPLIINTANAGQRVNESYVRQTESEIIDDFLESYENTVYDDYRNAYNMPSSVPQFYPRLLANVVAITAFRNKIKPNSIPANSWQKQTDLLMQAIDEFDSDYGNTGWGWKYASGPEHRGFTGYPLAFAASIMWNHLQENTDWDQKVKTLYGSNIAPHDSVAQKRAKIKKVLKNFASYIYDQRKDKNNNYVVVSDWYSQRQATEGPAGNSQAEEAAADAAFLAIINNIFSDIDLSISVKSLYNTEIKRLMVFAYSACRDVKTCAIFDNGVRYSVINHNMLPHPQYSLSPIVNTARAHIAYRQFDRSTPKQVYGGVWNDYGWDKLYKLYNDQFNNIDESNFRLKGMVCQYTFLINCDSFTTNNYLYSGVSDWGIGMYHQNSAFAFINYALYNRNNRFGALLNHMASNMRTQTNAGTVLLPPANPIWTWDGTSMVASWKLDRMKPGELQMPSGLFGEPAPVGEGVWNTHFILNAIATFDHMIAYMYSDLPTKRLSELK